MPSFQTISSVSACPIPIHTEPMILAFDRNWIQRAPAIVCRPDFVDGDFAGFFVDADFGDLRGVGVRRRRPDAGALVFAATSFERRRVGTCTGERAMEIDGGDNGFFKAHRIFRPFVFALLLQAIRGEFALQRAR